MSRPNRPRSTWRLAELKTSQQLAVRTEKLAGDRTARGERVGHELRNPLAAVRGAAAYMRKRFNAGKDLSRDEKTGQLLALIDRELGACTKIISDLLDVARERPLVLGPCPLHALVDEVIELLPPHFATVKNDVPEHLAVPNIDKDQFRQVLVNLVQNAVEAINDGAGEVRVHAETLDDRQLWRVTIADTGPGISPEVAARIFEPLFTTKTKGTGLGLAIVSTVVKRHDGSIRCRERSWQGHAVHRRGGRALGTTPLQVQAHAERAERS